jgi:hypothetical protein
MKMCFCRFLLAVGIIVLALFFYPAAWAKWVTIGAAGLLAVMSLFYKTCCCAGLKEKAKE